MYHSPRKQVIGARRRLGWHFDQGESIWLLHDTKWELQK